MFIVTSLSDNIFLNVNPLSAITSSPASNRSRGHDSLVISTADIHPVYKDKTKVTAPCGAIPRRHLKVFVFCTVNNNCGVWIC
jgi:hypothetical protein